MRPNANEQEKGRLAGKLQISKHNWKKQILNYDSDWTRATSL